MILPLLGLPCNGGSVPFDFELPKQKQVRLVDSSSFARRTACERFVELGGLAGHLKNQLSQLIWAKTVPQLALHK